MKIITFILLALLSYNSYSQVGIGTVSPNPSSLLDIQSTDKGILIPRVDIVNVNVPGPIDNPEVSLLVWSTNSSNEGFHYWNGSSWSRLSESKPKILAASYNTSNINVTENNAIPFNSTSIQTGIVTNYDYGYEIPVTGTYRVAFNINAEKLGNGNQNEGIYQFYLSTNNDLSGKIDGTLTTTELSNQIAIQNAGLSKIINLNANQTVYLRTDRDFTLLKDSSFSIEFLDY